jgi:CBS domain-containing protein
MADTTCADVMIANPVTLPVTATVGEAIATLLRTRFHHMPVVDAEGRFVGLFGGSTVAKAILPKAITMEGGLGDAAFFRETLADMRQRLDGLATRPALDFSERDIPTVAPDDPLAKGLQLLHRSRTLVAVVDAERRLKGVLAYAGLLAKLVG